MILFLSIITGRSSVIQYAAHDPLEHLGLTTSNISKTISSGLIKLLEMQKKGYVLSPKVFDVLNKLMKSDEDKATREINHKNSIVDLGKSDRICDTPREPEQHSMPCTLHCTHSMHSSNFRRWISHLVSHDMM